MDCNLDGDSWVRTDEWNADEEDRVISKSRTLVQDFVSSLNQVAFKFQPDVDLQEIADPELRAHAEKITSLVQEQHLPIIREVVESCVRGIPF